MKQKTPLVRRNEILPPREHISAKKNYKMQTYRAIFYSLFPSKSSCPQGHVGSNPTASATNPLSHKGFKGFLFCVLLGQRGQICEMVPMVPDLWCQTGEYHIQKFRGVAPKWCPALQNKAVKGCVKI